MRVFNSRINKSQRRELRNNTTKPEQLLWFHLKNRQLNGLKFRRQFGVGKFIVDFYCPDLRLAIELDGANHFFDDESTRYDLQRQEFIEKQGIKVLRFTNTEIFFNLKDVLDKISEIVFSLRQG